MPACEKEPSEIGQWLWDSKHVDSCGEECPRRREAAFSVTEVLWDVGTDHAWSTEAQNSPGDEKLVG